MSVLRRTLNDMGVVHPESHESVSPASAPAGDAARSAQDESTRGSSTPRSGRFQILALDGGGAKAFFTAHVLAGLERDLRLRIVDSFDLIAGTSAGGIVALALGAGLAPREIVERYEDLIAAVFPATRRKWWNRPSQAIAPIYDTEALRAALVGVLGDRKLGDSLKRLVIPSWDVQRGTVHIFKTPHHRRLVRDWQLPMVDIALATSAAPLYFPAARVDSARLIDGGVWANNPSVVAIAEAVSMLGADLAAIKALNVGTMDPIAVHPKRLDRGGALHWARPIAQLMLSASSRGAQGTAEHLLGASGYTRFDARVPGGLYALDSINAGDVAGLAASVSRELSPLFTERFASHVAAPYVPFLPDDGPGAGLSSSSKEDASAAR